MVKDWMYNENEVVSTKSGSVKILERTYIGNDNYKTRAYKYECLIDGNIDTITQQQLKQGHGCRVCANKKIKKGVNDLWTTHPHIAKLLLNPQDGYEVSYGSTKKLYFKCPYCGKIHLKSVTKITSRGFRCVICGDKIPIGEKILYAILSQFTDDVEKEKVFNWNSTKRYDFYSAKLNIICEVHGSQHYKEEFERIGKNVKRTLSEEQQNDLEKEKLANKNGFTDNYIVIDASSSNFDIIKNNILQSNLSKYIDLDQCNWEKIFSSVLKSKMIEVCELYNSGIKSTTEIGEILNLHPTTVCNYLKKCASANLCNYKASHYSPQAIQIATLAHMRKVICITTGEIFESCASAERKYQIKSKITSYCNGSRKIMTTKDGQKLQWMYYDEYLNLKL